MLMPFEEAVFDIETDDLLDATQVGHCIVVIDAVTRQVARFRPHEFADGCRFIQSCKKKIAHNGIWFDSPAIKKLTGVDMEYDPEFYDTLVLTRLIYSNIYDLDCRHGVRWGLPKKLYGSHSLKAWGYRLGNYKDGFGETADWSTYSEAMLDYCEQDVWVTVDLWNKCKQANYSPAAVRLEHDIAWVMAKQERNGFVFDERGAIELYTTLSAEKVEMEASLKARFGGWWKSKGVKTPLKSINYKDLNKHSRVKDAPFTAIEWVEFSPSSRQHIIKVLTERGWKPETFTDSGLPELNDDILKKLPWPEAKQLARYFLLIKRLGQIADGNQGWLKVVRNGRIHGRINPNGAVTGRATHSSPNIAQVPSCGAEYGAECRSLFTVPKGWVLMGSDASGLELRCLAHFMHRWDKGAYADVILNGDIHTVNQHAAGLPTRDLAKRFIYCLLYGGGDPKVGEIVLPDDPIEKQRAKGRSLKTKFYRNTPALKKLQEAVQTAAARGHIIGLDGRKIYIRSAHSALNALLQGAGGAVCKAWVCEVDRLAREKYGLKHGWDGDYAMCAWVHDEVQVACRSQEIADLLGAICKEAMKNIEVKFNFKCPLDAEYGTGSSWKDTH